MLEVLAAPPAVVAMHVSGHVDEADIERATQAIEAALATHERIGLLVDAEVSGMSPGALMKDVSYSVSKLRELHRFPRVAVVSSQNWVRAIAQAEGYVLPYVEVRTYSHSQREEALGWVSKHAEAKAPNNAEPELSVPSVRVIATTEPHVIAFELDGKLTSRDMRTLIGLFEEALNAHPRIRVLVRVFDFDGVTLQALREERLWSLKMRGLRQVERYALVGGPDWMQRVARLFQPMVPVETRYFERDDEARAWEWLEAKLHPEQHT